MRLQRPPGRPARAHRRQGRPALRVGPSAPHRLVERRLTDGPRRSVGDRASKSSYDSPMSRATHAEGWNHNIHYHGLVLDAVPVGATFALDAGCGDGDLARELRAV